MSGKPSSVKEAFEHAYAQSLETLGGEPKVLVVFLGDGEGAAICACSGHPEQVLVLCKIAHQDMLRDMALRILSEIPPSMALQIALSELLSRGEDPLRNMEDGKGN